MLLKNLVPLFLLLTACSSPVDGISAPATIAPATAPAILSSGSLVLTIFSPLDGSISDQAQITLQGNVSVDAVLSVNQEIFILPPGDFSIPLVLESGPNALEIVTSDLVGNEVDVILVVTYQQ